MRQRFWRVWRKSHEQALVRHGADQSCWWINWEFAAWLAHEDFQWKFGGSARIISMAIGRDSRFCLLLLDENTRGGGAIRLRMRSADGVYLRYLSIWMAIYDELFKSFELSCTHWFWGNGFGWWSIKVCWGFLGLALDEIDGGLFHWLWSVDKVLDEQSWVIRLAVEFHRRPKWGW